MSRPEIDLSVYLVTDTRLCGDVGVPATVAAAVAGGVSVVQLREPDADDDAVVELGRALVAALAGTGVPLIVNDRVHLVAPIGAAGAHIGQGDMDPVRAREVLGPDAVLGLSAQTVEHVTVARALGDGVVDHLGVGPLRAQATKPDAAPPIGFDGFAEVAEASPWPCVAIGGVGPADAGPLRRVGAAGMAVVSAICGRPKPDVAARVLRAAWDAAAETA